jgi:hypothetical protein
VCRVFVRHPAPPTGTQLSETHHKKDAGNLARHAPGLMVCITRSARWLRTETAASGRLDDGSGRWL